MRIERISETQIKFVLMNDDLEERDIKINELSYASDKTQQLFREIMTMVQDEHEFAECETPLKDISTVYLDNHSRTSVTLAKILAKHHWKISPNWQNFSGDITAYPRNGSSAAVVS